MTTTIAAKTATALTGTVASADLSVGGYGPGTRFVVVLAGCPLSCLYCHSPELQAGRSGTRRSVDEIVQEMRRHERFVRHGGGVTVSGGEPLLQPEFTAAVLGEARQRGLHTALDTSGALGHRAGEELLAATDLVLLDIKSWHPDTYRLTSGGGEVAGTLQFARRVAERGTRMWIRFVVVPGLTDAPSNVEGIARFVSLLSTVERVEVLPFQRLGEHKYAALGRQFPLAGTPEPDEALLRRVRRQFADHGLTVR